MRDDFSAKTINTLSRRAGFQCSNPHCRRSTVGANENKVKSTLVGVAAHITAASPSGARYDSDLTSEQRCSIENAIWLCGNCSTLIDKDPIKFPVEILKEWKLNVEKESSDKLLKSNSDSEIDSVYEVKKVKLSLEERAKNRNALKRKKNEIESFLRSPESIQEAKKQVGIIIEKIKNVKKTLEDQTTDFIFETISRNDDMYGIGIKGEYLCFDWCCPYEYRINHAIFRVMLFERTGILGVNMKDTIEQIEEYKYTRDIDGHDGWVDFETDDNFITTNDLVEKWIDRFLKYINYE